MAAARYWRIRAATIQASTNFALAEIEMRATAAGADQCAGGTAIASSVFAGSAAANAFDNSAATWWATLTNQQVNGWIGYDFGVGASITVLEIVLTARNDASFAQAPVLFAVEHSDDNVTWTEMDGLTAATWTIGSSQTFAVPAAPAAADPARVYAIGAEVLHSGVSSGRAYAIGLEVLRSIENAAFTARRRQQLVT